MCHMTFFQNFEPYFCNLDFFFQRKSLVFWKIKMSQTPGGVGWSKIGPKSVHVLFEWPLR